jgi:uncharacterized phage protein gp47/JayE
MVDTLPGEIVLPTRDAEIEKFKRSFRVRVPTADTGEGTQVDIDARVCADVVMALYATAKTTGDNSVLESARGAALDQWGEREGVGPRREAIGASGYVLVAASSGGTNIQAGDELRHEDSGVRFEVIASDHYDDGDALAIVGKDTGPTTNLAGGTVLKWSSPRPGCGAVATVIEQPDGSGLSGGRERESDDEYRDRILEEKQTRAASGNDAEYQLLVQNTPTVAVQKAFSYPAILHTGTTATVFTMRPPYPGGSRIPNAAQVALVESYVVGEMPADDGAFFCLLDNEDADVVYAVEWSENATGWADIVQWPPYYAPADSPGAIVVSAASSATSFTLATDDADYTSVAQPVIGQTIGFFDPDELEFVSKRILSFTGTGPWVITVDTSNNVSDTGYTPAVGQRAMPWSESLNALLYTEATDSTPASGILAYFDRLGPGEMKSTFYDEGRRQKRQPRPPRNWPFTLTTRDLTAAVTADEIDDVDVLEGDGLAPSVGSPGVLANILKLRYVSVFPQST